MLWIDELRLFRSEFSTTAIIVTPKRNDFYANQSFNVHWKQIRAAYTE